MPQVLVFCDPTLVLPLAVDKVTADKVTADTVTTDLAESNSSFTGIL